MEQRESQYLKTLFYNTKQGSSFSSAGKLYSEVKRRGTYTISQGKIKKWLRTQPSYNLYRTSRKRFPRPHIVTLHKNEQWCGDLMDLNSYKSANDGVRYLFGVTDAFTKYSWFRGLKTKHSSETAKAFLNIMQEAQAKPQNYFSDLGSEFRLDFTTMLKDQGIKQVFATTEIGSAIAERMNRTIKAKLTRYMFKKNTLRYIDVLPDIMESYNKTIHSTTSFRPIDITDQNEHLVLEKVLVKAYGHPKKVKPFKFSVGDTVRIAQARHPFTRETSQRWSLETFTVSRRYRKQNFNLYKITDCAKEAMVGTFYEPEMQVVEAPDDMVYRVDKILDEKTQQGVKFVKVKWLGYPNKCASDWMPKRDMRK